MKEKVFLSVIICILLLAGCQGIKEAGDKKSEYSVFYLNTAGNQIESVGYDPVNQDTRKLVEEYLEQLINAPIESGLQSALPKDVNLLSYGVENNRLFLYFDKSYSLMDTTREVLARAAMVRTFVQIPKIECISIYVEDAPLQDAKGNYVGIMTADSFVENVGRQINNFVEQNIVLYFATEDGKNLVEVEEDVYTTSNVSSEKLVLLHLMESNPEKGYISAIPAGTNLLSVSTLDGVCFVNFDSGFLEQNYAVSEQVVLYSIVNSLCELPNVSRVQISVNGETQLVYREECALDELYERNLDLITTLELEETEEETDD